MSGLPVAPFDPSRYIGTVCRVDPSTVGVNLPYAARAVSDHHAGYAMPAGQVGEFIIIESEEHAIIGRIIEVRLPERDRLAIEPTAGNNLEDANPIGVIQLLTSLELSSGKVIKGIPSHPRISQHVFSAHPLLIKHTVEQGQSSDRSIRLAFLPYSLDTLVSLRPEALLGRHCAVLGATGGGKSWTVAHIIEEIIRLHGKAILFDATGEFRTLGEGVRHVYLGGLPPAQPDARERVSFPFYELSESDLFVMFQPSSASQAPKLREALKSLKLATCVPTLAPNGFVTKHGQSKANYEAAMLQHAVTIAQDGARFDVQHIMRQIEQECVWANDNRRAGYWGNEDANALGYCTSLIARIGSMVQSEFMACIFKPTGLPSLPDIIRDFLADRSQRVLRVSMEDLPFEHHTRELVTNSIGRFLLKLARQNTFKSNPTVVVLDEAHQFLDKSLGDEYSRVSLDSFGVIAKEGRKYGLTAILATQRPRDIPEDVLSQMGMFVVHRLINERDRIVVEKACGSMDSSAAAFLPTLGQGEAILVGVESPMPLPIQIIPPNAEPESDGPQYADYWKEIEEASNVVTMTDPLNTAA